MLLLSAMNGSVSSDPESDKSSDTSLEEEAESVTPTCDALVNIANMISEKSYEPAVPNALTRNYLQEVATLLIFELYVPNLFLDRDGFN